MLQKLRIASSQEELCRIYILRYEVYVEEMGFVYPTIDDQKKMLYDHLDESATQFYVEDLTTEEIIGVCRINQIHEQNVDMLMENRYHISAFHDLGKSMSFLSKLMTKKTSRSICTINYIFRNLCAYGINKGYFVNFIDCSPTLVPFYERFGFRKYAENFMDSILGEKTPMVLFLEDLEHLKKVKSPLYQICSEMGLQNKDYSCWLEKNFQLTEIEHA